MWRVWYSDGQMMRHLPLVHGPVTVTSTRPRILSASLVALVVTPRDPSHVRLAKGTRISYRHKMHRTVHSRTIKLLIPQRSMLISDMD